MNLEQQSYQRIIENLYGGLYFVDRQRVITYWNKAAEQISGFSAEELVGKSCADNILTHVDAAGCGLYTGDCPLAATIKDGQPREAQVFLHHKQGHRVPVSVRVSTLTDEQGSIVGGIELFTDNSNLAVYQERVRELEKLALLDKLTGLANRAFIEKELETRWHEYRSLGIPFGLLFIDIDHFKQFNDAHGHDTGDEVLRFVANTFIANTRPFDIYGRWGGEEFIAIFRNVDAAALEQLGNRIRLLVANSYIMHNDQKLSLTISIGATIALPEDNADSLLRRADRLLYASKSGGRNRLTLG